MDPTLSQINPVRTLSNDFFKIYFNIIFLSKPDLPSGLPPSGHLTKTLYTFLPSPIRATCHAPLILLDLITRIIFGEQSLSISSSLCSFLHSPVTTPLLGTNIFLGTLLSNTLCLCYSWFELKEASRQPNIAALTDTASICW